MDKRKCKTLDVSVHPSAIGTRRVCVCRRSIEGLFLPLFWAVDCKSGEWKASPTRQSEMIMLRNKHTTSNIVAKFSQKPLEFPLDIAKLWWLYNELTLFILLRHYHKFSVVFVTYEIIIINQLKHTFLHKANILFVIFVHSFRWRVRQELHKSTSPHKQFSAVLAKSVFVFYNYWRHYEDKQIRKINNSVFRERQKGDLN